MSSFHLHFKGLAPTTLGRLLLDSAPSRRPHPEWLFLCVADHYEPEWNQASPEERQARVRRWTSEYPKQVGQFEDCLGRHPQHSYFIAQDAYDPSWTESLAQLERDGWGQIEVHLHHDHDTAAGLTEKLMRFKEDLFQRHGLLYKDDKGDIRYGFIHGNWALCNSRPDGRWCGVDNELDILRETGCYADYTLPSAPVPTQTLTVNQIYYPTPESAARLPHDLGEQAQVGRLRNDQLLLIQGPLALNWSRRKVGILPRLENGNLDRGQPPTIARMKQWLNASVQVAGWPDATFVKLHTHGAKPDNADMLLGEPMVKFHRDLIGFCEEREINLAYVTAREMYSLVKSAEAGITDPRVVLSAAPAQSLQAG